MITVPVPVPGGASQASHACVPTPRALAGESNCLWFKRFELGDLVSVLNLGALYHDLLCHPDHGVQFDLCVPFPPDLLITIIVKSKPEKLK